MSPLIRLLGLLGSYTGTWQYQPEGKVLNESWYSCAARPSCFRLFWHLARLLASRADWTAGRSRETSTPMIAITTSSSIRVNPATDRRGYGVRRITLPSALRRADYDRVARPGKDGQPDLTIHDRGTRCQ